MSSVVLKQIDRSKIEWTGPTYNPWQGCTKKSAGCKNCYMYRDKYRYGQDPTKCVRSAPATFNKPLKWQREVEAGVRNGQDCLVFTCSWSDFFNEEADPWRDEAWEIIRRCPGLQFQILTKLPERISDHLPTFWNEIKARCWMGTSVENQENDWRIGELMAVDAPIRFLSIEPQIGPIDLSFEPLAMEYVENIPVGLSGGGMGIEWVIVGGESGPDARPFHEEWATSICDQCDAAGVAFFLKQYGSNPMRGGKPIVFKDRMFGGDINEWPESLRIRQFPKGPQ